MSEILNISNNDLKILNPTKDKISNFQNNVISDNIVFELIVQDTVTEEYLDAEYIKLKEENNKSIFIYEDKIVLNPGIHLRSLGYSKGKFNIK